MNKEQIIGICDREIEMSKSAFDSIMAGLLEALAYARGDKSQCKTHIVKVTPSEKREGD